MSYHIVLSYSSHHAHIQLCIVLELDFHLKSWQCSFHADRRLFQLVCEQKYCKTFANYKVRLWPKIVFKAWTMIYLKKAVFLGLDLKSMITYQEDRRFEEFPLLWSSEVPGHIGQHTNSSHFGHTELVHRHHGSRIWEQIDQSRSLFAAGFLLRLLIYCTW